MPNSSSYPLSQDETTVEQRTAYGDTQSLSISPENVLGVFELTVVPDENIHMHENAHIRCIRDHPPKLSSLLKPDEGAPDRSKRSEIFLHGAELTGLT